MSVLIYIEVSDRFEVECLHGLHVRLFFKQEADATLASLVGTVTITGEMILGPSQIIENSVGFDVETAGALILAACDSCWNTLIIEGAAMTGMDWQPVIPWLARHFKAQNAGEFEQRV